MRLKKKNGQAPTEQAVGIAAAEAAGVETAPAAVEETQAVEASAPESDAATEKKPAKRRQSRRKPQEEAPAAKEPVKRKLGSRKVQKDSAPAEEPPVEKLRPGRRSKMDIPSELGLFVQYQGGEVNMAAIVEAVKEDFKTHNKRARIFSLNLYLKPEEHAAYYVINDSINGKVTF